MARPQRATLQCPPVLLVVVFVTLLAGYTLFLHERLAFHTTSHPVRMDAGAGGGDQSTQAARLQYSADSLRDGDGGLGSAASLVRRTAGLAAEVATLARDLEEKQARLQKNQVVRPLLIDKDTKQQQDQRQREQERQQQQQQQQQQQDQGQGQKQQEQQHHQGRAQEQQQARAGHLRAADSSVVPAEDWHQRQQAVVEAMRHAWGSYVQYAWGHDELDPVAKVGKDDFGGVGATIVDSLDTLWLMGLRDEFKAARDWTAHNLSFHTDHDSSVFETTIRVVGGLLAAHDLSGDAMFARRAQEIGDLLMYAFDTPTGIPHGTINLKSLRSYNPTWSGGASGLAEFGTEQLEYIKLSDWSGNATYARIAEGNVALLHEKYPDRGLLPYYISPQDARLLNNHITFGAMGDSYYEYLVKVWLLKGKTDDMYRAMWEKAMDEMIAQMIFTKAGLTYIAELQNGRPYHKMDHLACFAPAMLALGATYGAVTGAKADHYMQLAHNLTETCYQMYARQPTGLAPELVMFDSGDMAAGAAHNLLRPETAEALFVLWRTTHDDRYRRQGWAVFQAFEKHCRVEGGYAGLRDVTALPVQHDDKQQSFFLAETLKYLFLLFGPDDVLPLDEWVLNTEAHPLRRVPDFKSTYRTSTR